MAFARGHSQQQSQPSSDLVQLAVKGWAAPPSKFASNPEQGVGAIVSFLEKKSSRRIHSYKDIGKSHVLLIDVEAQDKPRFDHLNGFTFSGATIAVEDSRQRHPQHQQHQQNGAQPPAGPRSLDNRISAAPRGPRSQQVNFGNNQNPPTGPQSNHRHPS